MPNYKGHLIGGCVAFAAVLIILPPAYPTTLLTAFEWLLFTLAGSLFPDIDIKSKGQKYFYWMILILLILLLHTRRFIPLAAVSILSMIPMLSKHRGLFHRTWFIIAAPLIAWQIVALYFPAIKELFMYDMLFFIAGALSHLWLDMGLKGMIKI